MTEDNKPTDPQQTGAGLTDAERRVLDLARAGDDEPLTAQLDDGVPVELTAEDGNTLLMLAAYNGRASTVKLLAERGADVNRVNERGQTPIAGAVFKGATDVVHVLLAAGADPQAGTPNAVETARMFQQMALLEILEGRG